MVNLDEVPYAKALLGAVFIQYVIYAAIYIIEGAKYQDIHGKDDGVPGQAATAQAASHKAREDQKEGGEDEEEEEQKQQDPSDIHLEEQANDSQVQQNAQPQPAAATANAPQINKAESEEYEDSEFESAPFLFVATQNYQKMTVWFMLITALCAFRAALPLTVACAYIHVICRIVQMIGAIFKKRNLSRGAYGLATIMIVIMFFGVMVDQSHIISDY